MILSTRTHRITFACETPDMQARPIVQRCRNWGEQYRLNRIVGQASSIEGLWRPDATAGYASVGAPRAIIPDVEDAQRVEYAVGIMPTLFHNLLLRAWYVRLWSPAKCLATAAKASTMRRPRVTGFGADLEMAHALLIQALIVPAVVRKPRLRVLQHETLDAAA